MNPIPATQVVRAIKGIVCTSAFRLKARVAHSTKLTRLVFANHNSSLAFSAD